MRKLLRSLAVGVVFTARKYFRLIVPYRYFPSLINDAPRSVPLSLSFSLPLLFHSFSLSLSLLFSINKPRMDEYICAEHRFIKLEQNAIHAYANVPARPNFSPA